MSLKQDINRNSVDRDAHKKEIQQKFILRAQSRQKSKTPSLGRRLSRTLGRKLSRTSSRLISSLLDSLSFDERDDSVFLSNTYDEVMQQTNGIVRDFVCYRLKRSGHGCRVTVTKYPPASNQGLSNRILNIGRSFETIYPNLYRNLSRQLGYIFDSEATLRRLFFRISTHIIGTDTDHYTWGRVLAILCVSGAMAVDCLAQGHTELVEAVIKITSDYLTEFVLDWIIQKGGWSSLPEHFHPPTDDVTCIWKLNKFSNVYYVTVFALFGVLLFCAGILKLRLIA